MMYGNYGTYDEGNYGRRGVPGTGRRSYRGGYGRGYRGEDVLEEMKEHFENYMEGSEQMNRGNYGAEGKTMKALEYMLALDEDFIKMLMKDAKSPEEREMIEEHIHKMKEMI